MVQREHGKDVDFEVLEDVGSCNVFHQGIGFRYASIGNNNVKVSNAMLRLKVLDELSCIAFSRRVALGDDEIAVLALG